MLLVLVFVHELGHFLAAKWSKIKVHEFAIGFPPKVLSWKKGETIYSLNLIPFGGFVRIHGENPLDLEDDQTDLNRSMVIKPWYTQAWVLVAGVLFNVLFAWILISISFMFGYPTAVDENSEVALKDSQIMIVHVAPNSPASGAKLEPGEIITAFTTNGKTILPQTVEEVRENIQNVATNTPIILEIKKDNATRSVSILPVTGLVGDKPAIGISMSAVGILKYAPHIAVWEGLKTTGFIFWETTKGLCKLVYESVRGKASLESVTGPIGIAGMVGNASQFGFLYLLGFTALISINLAVINLVPFPALDGGRLLIVFIEAATRRKVPAVVQAYINGIGFLLLIGLMILVTVGDISKLFN